MAKTKPKTVAHDAPLVWTPKLQSLLELVFEGRMTHEKIAQSCTISLRACKYWIAHPNFQERLKALRANLEAALLDRGVAYVAKESRIIALSQVGESARCAYEARPWLQEKRQIGFDKEREEPLYSINENFNRDAFESFRGALDDIAKELGHRKTVTELTGKDGEALMTPIGAAIATALLARVGTQPQMRDLLATALLQEATIDADVYPR